jgi:uncharacterized membrane protein YbaN (DUF454 family)
MADTAPATSTPLSWGRDLRRWTFAAVGLMCVGLGWIGVFVPGMPTTIFLLGASYCFARSCPWLERRLLRVPIFSRYMAVLDEGRGMTRGTVISALISMWSCVGVSLLLLHVSGRLGPWIALTVVIAAVAGSATILLFARKPLASAS